MHPAHLTRSLLVVVATAALVGCGTAERGLSVSAPGQAEASDRDATGSDAAPASGAESPPAAEGDDQDETAGTLRAVPEDDALYVETRDGERTLVHRYDHPESETGFVRAAVRPGSTASDGLVVATVVSEGFRMIRWFHYADGEPAGSGEVAEPLRPDPDRYVASEVVPAPIWSADGSHVAWIDGDHTGEVVRLHLLSWDTEGPGTGATYDGSGFALDLTPGSVLTAWVDTETGATLHAAGPDGAATTIELEGDRQAGYRPAT